MPSLKFNNGAPGYRLQRGNAKDFGTHKGKRLLPLGAAQTSRMFDIDQKIVLYLYYRMSYEIIERLRVLVAMET